MVFNQEYLIKKMEHQTRVPVSCHQPFKHPGVHTDPFSLPRHGGQETQIQGQHTPQVCPPSPVSPASCWVRVKGTILELGCLSSSPRSHSSLSKPRSGCPTLNKSLHFLTSAMRVATVPRVSVTNRAPFVSMPLSPGFHHLLASTTSIKHLQIPPIGNKHPPWTRVHFLSASRPLPPHLRLCPDCL